MDYEDIESFMTLLDEDVQPLPPRLAETSIPLGTFENITDSSNEKKEGLTVFNEQTIQWCADTCGVSVDSALALQLADDVSYRIMDIINSCKKYLINTRQTNLSCSVLSTVLKDGYGFKCYGHEVKRFLHSKEPNQEDECSKSQIAKVEEEFIPFPCSLFLARDLIFECMDVEPLSFHSSPVYIELRWLQPNHTKQHPGDKLFYDSIISLLMRGTGDIPFAEILNTPHINRVGLQLIYFAKTLARQLIYNEKALDRLLDFLTALVNSKYIVTPNATVVCSKLIELAVDISSEKTPRAHESQNHETGLSFPIRKKAACLIADIVKNWDIGRKCINEQMHRVVDGLLRRHNDQWILHAGAILTLAALGDNIFKYTMFPRMHKYLNHIENLYDVKHAGQSMSKKKKDSVLKDVLCLQDALFHAGCVVYPDLMRHSNQIYQQVCRDGDLHLSQYLGNVCITIRHKNHRIKHVFPSKTRLLHQPDLALDLEDESSLKIRRRDREKNKVTFRKQLMITPIERTQTTTLLDADIITPLLNSRNIELSWSDKQAFVSDVYYRSMVLLQQLHNSPQKMPMWKQLRWILWTNYPPEFSKKYKQNVPCILNAPPMYPKRYPRIIFSTNTIRQWPVSHLKRKRIDFPDAIYHNGEKPPNHDVFVKRRRIPQLNPRYKYHSCNDILSVML